MKIIFVCTGNTCRSPMAEVIFANLCARNGRADVVVESAGTNAIAGTKMQAMACQALEACGESVRNGDRLATQWCEEMRSNYDHVISLSHISDPFMQPFEIYVEVCKQLQSELLLLYNTICKM